MPTKKQSPRSIKKRIAPPAGSSPKPNGAAKIERTIKFPRWTRG